MVAFSLGRYLIDGPCGCLLSNAKVSSFYKGLLGVQ